MPISIYDNSFMQAFEGPTRERLRFLVQERRAPKGTVVFNEYDPADCLYLVLDGQVELFKDAGEAGEQVIACVNPGEYFGEMGVIDGYSRSAGARTTRESVLGRLPGRQILELLEQEPGRASIRLFHRVLEHLRNLNDRYVAELVRKEKLHTVGAMAGTIIHDIKSPITGIQLVADLIGRLHDDPKTHKYCTMIRQQSDRMVAMVQELLDFSRGCAQLIKEHTTVSQLFAEFHQLNEEYFKQHAVALEMLPEQVPVYVDRQRMLRVFQNLVNNSVEAMGKKGGRLSLRAFLETPERVRVVFQDSGPGIPELIRDKLFEPFVTHGKKNGTGLGMAITKSIVEAHEGHISFTCPPGEGTRFVIELPVAQPSEEAETATASVA